METLRMPSTTISAPSWSPSYRKSTQSSRRGSGRPTLKIWRCRWTRGKTPRCSAPSAGGPSRPRGGTFGATGGRSPGHPTAPSQRALCATPAPSPCIRPSPTGASPPSWSMRTTTRRPRTVRRSPESRPVTRRRTRWNAAGRRAKTTRPRIKRPQNSQFSAKKTSPSKKWRAKMRSHTLRGQRSGRVCGSRWVTARAQGIRYFEMKEYYLTDDHTPSLILILTNLHSFLVKKNKLLLFTDHQR